MCISLFGGPFDGGVSHGASNLPLYLIARNHVDAPIYKKACACKVHSNHQAVPYVFVGYEADSYIWMDQELEPVTLEAS